MGRPKSSVPKRRIDLFLQAYRIDTARRLAVLQGYGSLSAYIDDLIKHDQRHYNQGAS